MPIRALLYSADSPDREPGLASIQVAGLSERELLWIDLSSPTDEELQAVADQIDCDAALLRIGPGKRARPTLSNHGHRFRLTAMAVALPQPDRETVAHWLTLIAGANYVVSVHEGGVEFVDELREREKGDTGIGALSSESFVASLLDWLLNTYFQALEQVVKEIDSIEVSILGRRAPGSSTPLVKVLIQARRRVAEIRRMLISHRDVFYGLARPDFMATENAQTRPHFMSLNSRLERAEDDVDHTRELVVGAFELLSMRAAQKTNDVMRALTYVTVLLGTLALTAGVLGMNFDMPLFHTGTRGFLVALSGMLGATLLSLALAKWRKWI
ncbi:MAG: CorA family divalent cation transporter [Arenimonas sp.]